MAPRTKAKTTEKPQPDTEEKKSDPVLESAEIQENQEPATDETNADEQGQADDQTDEDGDKTASDNPPESPLKGCDENTASCVLNTSLATEFATYKPGDVYTATPESIQRLIDRGMAKPVEA
ncbi:hypothetical protein [Vibrio parahaemolyticus]|uniref:hypothetical protein n=1 Tax=Vibrio parahaemolyticus TaxID=670 RepID=UPI00146E05D0|nr:hypothetical protein [Vibrio parahaemolyticus]MDF4554912.1 hypothetical protein [Vibrio parahaemolyticus]MDF5352799.1 hypothetical protein [Vibrio parahaemolyticus]MDF5368250.1 hypothetical protein [Vibrio parahaemolyticus]MDG2771232.1 hypothetical protein [Vibrio parahaemolyticus]MDG2826662.1 hypothetical protein [Vibrio parahaemolyticus]